LLFLYLNHALKKGVKNISVICDSKLLSKKDIDLWNIRTKNKFDIYGLGANKIYTFARQKIPFYFVNNHNDVDCLNLIASLKINCLFNAGTPRKLSDKIISNMEYGVVNVHPGILPFYRGCSAVEWAILNNDPIGNTVHYMDSGYDSGPIVIAEKYKFKRNSTYEDIRIKTYRKNFLLASKVLLEIQKNKLTPDGFPKQDVTEGKNWPPIGKNDMKKVLSRISKKLYIYQCL